MYLNHKEHQINLKPYLKEIVKAEIRAASEKESAFEIVWFIFFSRYIGLGITGFTDLVDNKAIQKNLFVQCMVTSQNKLYAETKLAIFQKPSECKGTKLVDRLDVFQRNV